MRFTCLELEKFSDCSCFHTSAPGSQISSCVVRELSRRSSAKRAACNDQPILIPCCRVHDSLSLPPHINFIFRLELIWLNVLRTPQPGESKHIDSHEHDPSAFANDGAVDSPEVSGTHSYSARECVPTSLTMQGLIYRRSHAQAHAHHRVTSRAGR